MKLIFRNKRPKMAFWMSVFMVFYGLVFYTQEQFLGSPGWLSFVGIFITGMFLFNYGQFLIAWNSQFFDKVLTLPINLRTYVESKYWFLMAMTGISFLLSIPYIYYGWTIVFANLMACLFNLGINTMVILFFSTEKTKRIHLAKTTVFNYEGITAVQFIMMLPAMLLPVFIVLPFSLNDIPLIGFGVLGFIGLIGIFTGPIWLKYMVQRLEKSKYRVAAGLRKE